ncbi:MAG: ABC transporter permease [Burkholderiales bacterium]|nr:ABC transporter permease [Burkholderiales bacterium]
MFRSRLRLLALALRGHWGWRTTLTVAGIALGVALGFAVLLVNRAAVNELAAGVRALAGEADLQVHGGRQGFDERLFAELARLPGVALASPVLELEVGLAAGGTLRLVGLDPFRAARIQPALFGEVRRRAGTDAADTVLLSAAAADLAPHGTLAIVVGLELVELRVAGVLPASSLRGMAALADIATAQWRLGRLGQLNRIDLRLAPGTDREALRARIAAMLPPGTHVSTLDAVEESSANLSRAYRVNLNVLALVALFTGGFMVFSAQALEAARRRGEHALLRVLGLERGALERLVLAEVCRARRRGKRARDRTRLCARARRGRHDRRRPRGVVLSRGARPEVPFPAAVAALYFAAGVAIALAGAWLPAVDAARVPPAQALRAGDVERMFERTVAVLPGAALLATGGLLAQLPPVAGLPIAGYAAIGCLLVGGIALMPWLAASGFARLPLARRPALALAAAQLRGAPGQATVSLAAIVASFSRRARWRSWLAPGSASRLDRWLDAAPPAGASHSARHSCGANPRGSSRSLEAQVRALPQIRACPSFIRSQRVILDPARPAVALACARRGGGVPAVPSSGARTNAATLGPPPAWISEAVQDARGWRAGDRIELPLAGRSHPFVVAGIWRDDARQHGAIVIEREVYVALTGDRRANDAALWLAPGATPDAAERALRALPGGALLDVAGPGEIRAVSLAIFDRTFAVTYALEAVAMLVGLFGLSSSIGAIVLARRREFGMLRHVGMTRAQIGEMLAAEGGLLARRSGSRRGSSSARR